MKVNLTVVEGPEKGKVFSFDEPENFLFGRSVEGSKAHLCLSPDDTFVSRNHFLLEINPPDCFIRDAGSLNGTFIVRASEKTIFYLPGRSEDKETYSLMADRLQKELSFKSFLQIDNRLPLQDKDIIKVGRTEISVNVVKEKSSSCGYQISLDHGAEELFRCIEGYVHRDIKPENILLLKDSKGICHAKVADFGLARSFILHGGTVTRANEWIGTTFYCPPEQILDFKNAHPATDVYAMGMALYFILSGAFPYDFAIGPDTVKKKKQRDPIACILGDDKPMSIGKKVPGLPIKLATAIDRAIEKNLQKRTQTAQEFEKDIEVFAK